ncbi:universal stress protein [Arenibacter palladensis]|uniref:universal stress protein n=1 Tax=Arenibacter palladensis TaxID=237373 RepID=UPI0026E1695D|nr:universal stress protein [Arenibacter palladensis]MDO6602326.1 universal stress protein [Arenibacter palladensis]
MRAVLIPTDFSKSAMHAIDYALNLYKCERTNFYFLHAYADEVYGPFKTNGETSFEEQKETVRNNTDKSLKDLIQKLAAREHNPKHTYETLSAFDTLVDAVNDLSNQINVDLVIMGTKGQTADKKITFGSHTVQVFKYVQCPVLAVPLDYKYHQPKKILFPTDYMLPYKRRELKLLNTLAAEFKSEIHCLYISDFEDLSNRQIDNQRFLRESLAEAFLFFERLPTKNKAEAIMDYIKKNNINLLVMLNSRHSFLEDMLYRSTVDEIGLRLKIPFLVMQNLPR